MNLAGIQLDVKGMIATRGVDAALNESVSLLGKLLKFRKLSGSYKSMLESICSIAGLESGALDELVVELRTLDNKPNVDYVFFRISEALRTNAGISSKEAEELTLLLFAHVSSVNSEAKANIDVFLEKVNKEGKQREESIVREKRKLELRDIVTDAIAAYSRKREFYTVSEVEADLVGITRGILDLSFFDGTDAIFEGNLKSLVSKGTLVINIYSNCRREALLYVLRILSDGGCGDRVKVIKTSERWMDAEAGPGDILVTGFTFDEEVRPHPGCVNIKIHERTSVSDDDWNSDNHLMMRSRTPGTMKRCLYDLFGVNREEDRKRAEELFEKTNGYYSLIETALMNDDGFNSWRNIILPSEELNCLEEFLVVPVFSKADKAVMEKAGIDFDKLLKTAEVINSRDGAPLFLTNDKKDRYTLTAPDRVWKFCSKKDSGVTRFFIEKALAFLLDKDASPEIVNNILYTFIRHYGDFEPKSGAGEDRFVYTDETLFDRVSPVLLQRPDGSAFMRALTELAPERMFEWFRANPSEISDENAGALFLLMHDSGYSLECMRLILSGFDEGDFTPYGSRCSLNNIVLEFFRSVLDTSGVTVEEIIAILNDVRDRRRIRKIIFYSLYRDYDSWFSYNVYRYRDSVVPRKRSEKEIEKLESFKIGWYLEEADQNELVDFVKNVDFLYFDFEEPLGKVFNRIKETESEENLLPLYMAVNELYDRKKDCIDGEGGGKLTQLWRCLEIIRPSSPWLSMVPLLTWNAVIGREKDTLPRSESYALTLMDIVRKNDIALGDYLKIPRYCSSDQLLVKEYFYVLFKYYNADETVSSEVFSVFEGSLCSEYISGIVGYLGEKQLDFLFEKLPEDDRFRLVSSADYCYIRNLLLRLPCSQQKEYWTSLHDFSFYRLDKNEMKSAFDNLLNAGNCRLVLKLVSLYYRDLSDAELCAMFDRVDGNAVYNFAADISHDVFPRLRAYSDNGGIAFEKVYKWETEFLSSDALTAPDTFFTRRFNSSPDIFCGLFLIICPPDNGTESEMTPEEKQRAREIFVRIKSCPGVDGEYNVNELHLSSWIDAFISKMKEQKQEDLIPRGIAKVLAWSVPSFSVILSDEVCRILERMDKRYKGRLASFLAMNLKNRQGGHIVTGSVSGSLAVKFRDYADKLKRRGFETAADVYEKLVKEYTEEDKEERDRL